MFINRIRRALRINGPTAIPIDFKPNGFCLRFGRKISGIESQRRTVNFDRCSRPENCAAFIGRLPPAGKVFSALFNSKKVIAVCQNDITVLVQRVNRDRFAVFHHRIVGHRYAAALPDCIISIRTIGRNNFLFSRLRKLIRRQSVFVRRPADKRIVFPCKRILGKGKLFGKTDGVVKCTAAAAVGFKTVNDFRPIRVCRIFRNYRRRRRTGNCRQQRKN